VQSTKKQIRDAVSTMYDIQTKKINTLIRCVPARSPSPCVCLSPPPLVLLQCSLERVSKNGPAFLSGARCYGPERGGISAGWCCLHTPWVLGC